MQPYQEPQFAPPPRQRSPYAVPVIALSVTLVALVAAIVIVVLVKSARERTAKDSCVVGGWLVARYEERVAIEGVGPVLFTGTGARLELRADGTGRTDYGAGTVFTGNASGKRITLMISGAVTFHYRAADHILAFSDVRSTATSEAAVGDEKLGRTALAGNADPANYTCAGGKLTEQTATYRAELTRES
ncbi:MAG TPA: hypothetical protein VFE14_08210 [Micromonosporaceae bacterium]|nr:hypothetical protein [Micromonosporaceae bacterium]